MSHAQRRLVVLVLGAAVAALLAAVALGQDSGPPPLEVSVGATPALAGTPRHPQGIRITVRGTVNPPRDAPAPVPRTVDAWLPKGWVYNGAEHPACTARKLARGGPAACPAGSIMSHEVGHAYVDDATPPPTVTVVNGGATTIYFWTVIHNPARVQAAVPGRLTKLRSSRFSYRLHADVPQSLRVVAGLPIGLGAFALPRVGRGDWFATTSCPRDHHWRYRIAIGAASGQVFAVDRSLACRRYALPAR